MTEAENAAERLRGDDQAIARAKLLPRKLPIAGSPPVLVPARMVNEVLYCERLMYLEWAQGEFADNAFTVEGRFSHRRADQPSGTLPQPASEAGGDAMPFQVRSLWLSSERIGATAKIDVVEGEAGCVTPIEYKRGEAPDLPEGAYLPERAQVALQVMLLRDQGYRCDEGAIWFARSRKRVPIVVDDALVETVERAIARARALVAEPKLPPPLEDSPKCDGCSLVGICLPDEVTLLRRLGSEDEAPEVGAPRVSGAVPVAPAPGEVALASTDDDDERASAPARELRRLLPARDDRVPVYVQEYGARVGIDGELLVVHGRSGTKSEARLPNTSQVSIFGNVHISPAALRALIERDIPVCFFSSGGWFVGRTTGHGTKNVELRVAQYRAATDRETCLSIARGIVVSKIKNARTILRRNHPNPPPVALKQLEFLARKAVDAADLGVLLGLEGSAARTYFEHFAEMLKGSDARLVAFDFDGRNRRPPRDRVNALLSFVYALLTKEVTLAVASVGLDPLLGFYHQPRFGRPALALDLMEEMRPLLADSVVLSVINTGVVEADDFLDSGTAVAIMPHARKKVVLAFERRLDQLVTHPVFGYRISYRRVLEVQARLLSRLLLGEISELPAFRTR